MSEGFQKQLEEIAGARYVKVQEPMALHTTFRIGGPADYYVTPATAEQAAAVLRLCREEQMPAIIVGNGSNLLVRDRGIRGVVLAFGGSSGRRESAGAEGDRRLPDVPGLYEVRIEDRRVRAGAGVLLSTLAVRTAAAGLGGLEYAGGIPGTLGGGIFMNAGAYGGEMGNSLQEVLLLKPDGEFVTVPAAEMEFGYRTSRIQRSGEIILAAVFDLQPGEPAKLQTQIQELNARRREKQPLEYPSAGSTFRRPQGYFAGKLIQDAGLAGFRVGDAQVSEKHCGFVINRGEATAAQVLELISQVQERVQARFGVLLEPEVRIVGE